MQCGNLNPPYPQDDKTECISNYSDLVHQWWRPTHNTAKAIACIIIWTGLDMTENWSFSR